MDFPGKIDQIFFEVRPIFDENTSWREVLPLAPRAQTPGMIASAPLSADFPIASIQPPFSATSLFLSAERSDNVQEL